MKSHQIILLAIVLAICSITSIAQLQPPPLQDFCVGDFNTTLFIDGRPCIAVTDVTDENFYYGGPGPITGSSFLPGSNTLAIRKTLLVLPPSTLNPPHFHPRATELVVVLEGRIEAGFVTSGPEHKLYKTILKKGDVFVVPYGLVHFQSNLGKDNSTAEFLVYFNHDLQGSTFLSPAIFASEPKLPLDVLAKSFQVDEGIIKQFQAAFE